ncbi:MAG TPA: sigma-E factor negative regulatory protein, partial [Arenimonas sp.]|nr:sigma-E factor negative regulatory protein [Arenimonas sp.]
PPQMTQPDQNLLEDLCAWMDGQLPPDQARFLERRIGNEPALQAQLERWYLASATLRGQAVRLRPDPLSADICAAVRREPMPGRGRRWPWAAGVAAAMLALALLPGLVGQGGSPGLPPAPELARSEAPRPPLVDMPQARLVALPRQEIGGPADGLTLEPSARPWPRSPLGQDERDIEAYLVRHNAMMAADGLGGFMPYVDVVAHGEPGAGEDAGSGNGRR